MLVFDFCFSCVFFSSLKKQWQVVFVKLLIFISADHFIATKLYANENLHLHFNFMQQVNQDHPFIDINCMSVRSVGLPMCACACCQQIWNCESKRHYDFSVLLKTIIVNLIIPLKSSNITSRITIWVFIKRIGTLILNWRLNKEYFQLFNE